MIAVAASSKKKTVLAIDSSLACPAFAVVEFDLDERTAKILHKSHIKTTSKNSTGKRLFMIHNHIQQELLLRFEPNEVVFEKGFNKFALATQQIQRTVGVLLMTLYHYGHENIHELSPTTVKKAVTGNGKASKDELAAGLEKYVGKQFYMTDDESDAVGVAIAFGKQKNWL